MSYSRRYTQQVYYSGTVSYPASEHGGTKSFSGYVPVSIDLTVDTRPFDRSVDRCEGNVNLLTGSVVSMNAAQVASINESANEIATHVTNGFYNMISSEISQEIAQLYNKFNAIGELMEDRSKTLEKQMLIMQDDYRRTSDRYNKIFTDLDEELKKRVVALDKNAYEIANKIQAEQLHENVSKQVSRVVIGVNEDEIINQQLLVANENKNVNKVIGDLGQNVIQELVYAKTIQGMLTNSVCSENTVQYIPVVYTEEEDMANAGTKKSHAYAPGMNAAAVENTQATVRNFFGEKVDGWHGLSEEEQKSIDTAFKALAEQQLSSGGENSKRIYDMIMQLKNQSETLTM